MASKKKDKPLHPEVSDCPKCAEFKRKGTLEVSTVVGSAASVRTKYRCNKCNFQEQKVEKLED